MSLISPIPFWNGNIHRGLVVLFWLENFVFRFRISSDRSTVFLFGLTFPERQILSNFWLFKRRTVNIKCHVISILCSFLRNLVVFGCYFKMKRIINNPLTRRKQTVCLASNCTFITRSFHLFFAENERNCFTRFLYQLCVRNQQLYFCLLA